MASVTSLRRLAYCRERSSMGTARDLVAVEDAASGETAVAFFIGCVMRVVRDKILASAARLEPANRSHSYPPNQATVRLKFPGAGRIVSGVRHLRFLGPLAE